MCVLSSADFFQNKPFQKIISGKLSVGNSLGPDFLSVLFWVQTVCKSYEQAT